MKLTQEWKTEAEIFRLLALLIGRGTDVVSLRDALQAVLEEFPGEAARIVPLIESCGQSSGFCAGLHAGCTAGHFPPFVHALFAATPNCHAAAIVASELLACNAELSRAGRPAFEMEEYNFAHLMAARQYLEIPPEEAFGVARSAITDDSGDTPWASVAGYVKAHGRVFSEFSSPYLQAGYFLASDELHMRLSESLYEIRIGEVSKGFLADPVDPAAVSLIRDLDLLHEAAFERDTEDLAAVLSDLGMQGLFSHPSLGELGTRLASGADLRTALLEHTGDLFRPYVRVLLSACETHEDCVNQLVRLSVYLESRYLGFRLSPRDMAISIESVR